MDGEIITSSQSSQTRSSVEKINILVVDDDTTCLSIVAAILKTWKYEVVTVKHAIDALCTLRIMEGSFDLVVSDVHMPDMNGFELQKQIDREFNLPVVLMSADDKDCVVMKGLENGAALFLVKPIAPDDLKNLWQYAFLKKKKKCKAVVDNIGFPNEDIESESSAYDNKKDSKRKVAENDHKSDEKEEEEENDDLATTKKPKVIWTNTLHNKFLEAIKILGLDRAVPKKILEFMNIPGLTRENVASHLQKYRIFLKRVSDASYKIQYAAENSLADMAFRSNFVSGQPSLTHQNQMMTSFQPTFEKHVPVAKTSKHDHLSTCGSISRPLYGQSLLISNRGTMKQPMIGNSNSMYQTNRFGLNGGISSGLMTAGTNLIQMYQKKTPPTSLTDGLSMYNYSKFGHGGANNSIGYGKLGNFKNSNTKLNLDSSHNRYVGYRIASGNGGDELDGYFKGDYGLINGIQLSNMTTGSILGGNGKACLAKEVSSSSGFVGSNPKFTNAIQQENGSVPQKKDNPVQDVESIDDLFALLTSSSTSDNNSLQHGKGDLRSGFLNTQGGGEDPHFSFSFSSNNVEDHHQLGNKQSLEKQYGEEDMDSNFSIGGSQLDDYFPWFDKSTKQQQDYEESFNNIIFGNQASPIQFDDDEFLKSVFSDGAFGGSDGLGGL